MWLDKRHLVVDVPPDATLIYVGLPLLYSVSDWKGNVKFAAGFVAEVLDDERYSIRSTSSEATKEVKEDGGPATSTSL